MKQISEILNPLGFPLYGSRLIEASAGTGKTYTIAALYVRLILGHGGKESAYLRPLTPAEILVVTYTNAATQELRDRIRIRLTQAANYFRNDADMVISPDAFLGDLRADYPAAHWPAAARRLQLAAESMDDAAISTIHSWCHRILQEHAFNIGNLFSHTLENDQNELLTAVVHDYWRTIMVALDADAVRKLKDWQLMEPNLLLKKIKDLLKYTPISDEINEPELILSTAYGLDDFLNHARRWIVKRFSAEKKQSARIGTDDLLTQLDAALQGPHGPSLAEAIRQKFPVALIDEFQDTDPIQYRIFDAIYRVAHNDPHTALVMIGDPKQAIYSFRGADIYTYLTARRACHERHYTLTKNFRSTFAMVAATNHFFNGAELRNTGDGAFLFRSATDNPIPFLDATARGLTDDLYVDGVQPPALTIWLLEANKKINKPIYRNAIAEICAGEIVQLLNHGQKGTAIFVGETPARAIQPGDIAVLVNKRNEAAIIRAALLKHGVRSVYLSEKDSVFQCPQAADLQHWLAACAEPDNTRLIRSALATATLKLSWAKLERLNHDELIGEKYALQFRSYYDCWQRQGVLPMLRRLLNDFQIPAQLLRQNDDGERILTNILHLAELLQQASYLLNGEPAIIRYLAAQRQKTENNLTRDADQIRLESDANLVQIVTVHKAKGLTYPLVFFPFASDYRDITRKDLPLVWHNNHGQICFTLSDESDAFNSAKQAATREQLGEDLRKFYVALTRARYATWVGIAPLAGLERSAYGYLLSGGAKIDPPALAQKLANWRGTCESIKIYAIPVEKYRVNNYFTGKEMMHQDGRARKSQRVVREHWWIASYSALKSLDSAPSALADTPRADVFHETLGTQKNAVELPNPLARVGTLHDFPRGPEVGNFFHDLLEWTANQGFARLAEQPEILRDMIARRCNLRGWEVWIEPLTTWLRNFLITPWPLPVRNKITAATFSFAQLKFYLAEMEFWIAVHQVPIQTIDALLRSHTLNQAARPALQPGQMNGMLKGFIDLIFEQGGRYYVVDYKSNWLGADYSAYTTEAMRNVILQARYELQYVLYLFALHRLLKARLPDYHYDRHVGGAIYLFLRGADAPGQGIYLARPQRELMEKLDILFAGAARPLR